MSVLTWTAFLEDTVQWAQAVPDGERRVVAVAGPPGSGKSTLADALVTRLNADATGTAAVLPMDGYHFDDEVLVPRGWRPRKGAPHTFDVGGFAAMLNRLRKNSEPEIALPRFDRDLEIARGGAVLVPQSTRVIVAEGNYLLLDERPWQDLAALYDRTVFLDVPLPELERRLTERWVGLGLKGAALREKLDGNDLPNARQVIEKSRPADIRVSV